MTYFYLDMFSLDFDGLFFQPLTLKVSSILLLIQLIGRTTSCQFRGSHACNFKSLAQLLPELYFLLRFAMVRTIVVITGTKNGGAVLALQCQVGVGVGIKGQGTGPPLPPHKIF